MTNAIIRALLAGAALAPAAGWAQGEDAAGVVELGPRPFYLVDAMREGELKDRLSACFGQEPRRTLFSIGHRGAPMQFPEHTVESNRAAARMGAGILECDVTFTADQELVCRHAQDDLHTTTDILVTDLASKCTQGFQPAGEGEEEPATAECRTSDITLDEFRTLDGKMDAALDTARTAQEYQGGVADWRTTLYTTEATGTLMTHAESIELFRDLGAKFTPELKAPVVEMPFEGFAQEDYAQKLIDEYRAAGVPPEDVWAQSFDLADVLYWIEAEPEFGAQAVYLDDRYEEPEPMGDDPGEVIDPSDPATFEPTMQELADMGVRYLAPPLWMLVTTDEAGEIVPSAYAEEARAAGLELIAWSLERSGPLAPEGGEWYWQSVEQAARERGDGLIYELVDVLAQDVGVAGIFSDWPATVSFYASCMGLD